MARILVKGLGLVFSGDIAAPRLEADAILIEGGKIAGIGKAQDFTADSVIDAQGCAWLLMRPSSCHAAARLGPLPVLENGG